MAILQNASMNLIYVQVFTQDVLRYLVLFTDVGA